MPYNERPTVFCLSTLKLFKGIIFHVILALPGYQGLCDTARFFLKCAYVGSVCSVCRECVCERHLVVMIVRRKVTSNLAWHFNLKNGTRQKRYG